MIDQEKVTLDWIEKVSKANRKADKILVEKVIRAILLLEGLVKLRLPFVFKGGTALMLHLNFDIFHHHKMSHPLYSEFPLLLESKYQLFCH